MNQPSAPGPYKRKIIIIKKALQIKYLGVIILTALLTLALIFIDNHILISKSYSPEMTAADLWKTVENFHTYLMIHVFFLFVVIVFISVYISHRFAGPIYRIEKLMELVSAGNFTARARLRNGDEFGETAGILNKMIDSLQEMAKKEIQISNSLKENIEQLAAQIKAGKINSEQASRDATEIAAKISRICSHYKV